MSNKLKQIIIVVLLIVTAITFGYSFYSYRHRVVDTTDYTREIDDSEEFVYNPEVEYIYEEERLKFAEEVETVLRSMNLKEKVSQMFLVDADDIVGEGVLEYDETVLNALDKFPLAGLVYKEDNVESYYQINALLSDTDAALENYKAFKPFKIYKGNPDSLYFNNAYNFYGSFYTPKELSKTSDLKLSESEAKELAKQLKNAGFDGYFGPNCNVSDEDVSFGLDPIHNSELSSELVEIFNENKLFAIANSFPYLKYEDVTFNELLTKDLIVYQEVIDSEVSAIMVTSDACFPITGLQNVPTMASKRTVDLLRARMGFEGVIVSDSICNVTLREGDTIEELVSDVIGAGVDLIYDVGDYQKVIDYIVKEVEEGKISLNRIDNAVGRILTYKNNIQG